MLARKKGNFVWYGVKVKKGFLIEISESEYILHSVQSERERKTLAGNEEEHKEHMGSGAWTEICKPKII